MSMIACCCLMFSCDQRGVDVEERYILARKALPSASDIACPPLATCPPLLYNRRAVVDVLCRVAHILSRRRHIPRSPSNDIPHSTGWLTCVRVPEL